MLQNGNVDAEYDSILQSGEAKFVLHNQISDSLFKTRHLVDCNEQTSPLL